MDDMAVTPRDKAGEPLFDPIAYAREIAREAVRQNSYTPRWVSLKQASEMLGGVDQKTLRKWRGPAGSESASHPAHMANAWSAWPASKRSMQTPADRNADK